MTPRSTLVETIARAMFSVVWGHFPDAVGPSFDHDRDVFMEAAERAMAAIHDDGCAVVPREAGSALPDYPKVTRHRTLYRDAVALLDLTSERTP